MSLQANPPISQDKFSQAWSVFVAGEPTTALKTLSRKSRLSSEQKKQLDMVHCLQAYDYPELKELSNALRWEFALVASWNSLLEAYSYQETRWAKRESLASLLGSGYILDIDIETLGIELDGQKPYLESITLPIAYEQSARLWPEFSPFPRLSLLARTVFIRIIQYVDSRTSLADVQRIGLRDTPNAEPALDELSKAGLIDPVPPACSLLMGISLTKLKRFAFDNNIEPYGPKHRLIQSIVAQAKQTKIQDLIDDVLRGESYVCPLTKDLPLLKRYVWAETHRIDLYLRWVQQIHCLKIPARRITVTQDERQTGSSYSPMIDPMKPWTWTLEVDSGYSPKRGWKNIEKKLVREIWDTDCDNILLELAEKYAWNTMVYVGKAVANHLPPEKLRSFIQACERNETRSYSSLLSHYGELRLLQMKVKLREPRLLKCAGCGKGFLEWSINPSIAERVCHKIHFCADCYQYVFWSSDYSASHEQLDETTMLDRLYKLAVAMGSVPMATFMQNPSFISMSDEEQVAIVRALFDMPSYKVYLGRFGSWLRALILAGVLEDGTQQTSRGIRCIAADGHECLSLAEKIVDDWMTDHHISHDKEPPYPYHAHLNPSGMRADWKVNDTLIEYAGLLSEPEYAAKMDTKQALAEKYGFSLIVIRPDDILNLDKKLGRLCSMGNKR